MIWRIDVFPKRRKASRRLKSEIKDLGITKKVSVYTKDVYLVEAEFTYEQILRLAENLLVDPVIQNLSITKGIFENPPTSRQILITHNPGVCDSVSISLEKAAGDLSLPIKAARTARFYEFEGLDEKEIEDVARRILYNPLIEHIIDYFRLKNADTLDEFSGCDYKFDLITTGILDADKNRLQEISENGCLSLSLEEMEIIREYFNRAGRNPTDCEIETIATLWSEHCAHKTFRGIIEYQECDENGSIISKKVFDNLLKTTIMRATSEINSASCVSVFGDNSGIVVFDETHNVCFKVETHNHPSSLEPYGGASTGIGGVIRDILGTGCSAKPFASIDVFCFSDWHMSYDNVPEGLLHPKRIIKGVIKGVRDYGNRMGIPTVAGAVMFDERFLGNPLVYCGTLGILPKEKSFKKASAGDLVILCGAKTGRDGIHGATFSSRNLDEQTVGLTSAVQIGNPIEEKKLSDSILRAQEKDLFDAITDCGAGGICSAVTELAQDYGVEVHLDKVPLKYRGLSYTEIWISESQERMILFAKEENLKELKRIFNEEDVEFAVIGKVTDTRRLALFYSDQKVCEIDMDFIFSLPQLKKDAFWVKREEKNTELRDKKSFNKDLIDIISKPNIACKDWIIREYDHEVQGGSVIKSVSGINTVAVNDASCIRPKLDSDKCVAVGVGINPFYSDLDPYWMAALAIDEALRNVVCVGASLEKTFILDNFSWGSPVNPEVLGGLVRATQGCYDFSVYYKVPFISGKDSLYNEYDVGDNHISIPGTLLISAMSIIDDYRKVKTASFKNSGNLIYLAGITGSHMGQSEYFRSLNIKDGFVPKINRKTARDIFIRLSAALSNDIVISCHDLSEGGLSVCLSEMCIGSQKGASVFLGELPCIGPLHSYEMLFSESPTRFIVEVEKQKKDEFEKCMEDLPFGLIGCVSEKPELIIHDAKGKEIIRLGVDSLRKAWLKTFKDFRF
ncbi:MAG: phosphoribosylformylglycinamidine synthase subunit PurL [Candidatus Omnitrophota bacterium]